MSDWRLDISPAAAIFLALVYYLDDAGWFSAAVPAILCHELGHWIALRCLGGRMVSLRFELSGLCMENTAIPDRASELAILAAGPAFGWLWGIAAGIIGGTWGEKSRLISIALTLYNLLPALPLDGGRMLLVLSASPRLLRWTGCATAVFLLLAAFRFRRWALLLPSLFLFAHSVRS